MLNCFLLVSLSTQLNISVVQKQKAQLYFYECNKIIYMYAEKIVTFSKYSICYKLWSELPLTKTRGESPSATSRPSRDRDQEERDSVV